MGDLYRVTATLLNLRAAPRIAPGNVIATLQQGQQLQLVEEVNGAWMKAVVPIGGSSPTGYVSRSYVEPVTAAPAPVARGLEVHYPPHPDSRLDSLERRHCPLALSASERRPFRLDASDGTALRVQKLQAILQYLDVEESARYQPKTVKVGNRFKVSNTYCNIYAYDFCYLAGVYLPRVWWRGKALAQVLQGKAQPVEYGVSVSELNANALYDWFLEWGDDLGWKRSFNVVELQERVNDGAVGIICAQRHDLSRSGHIVAVLPETAEHTAEHAGGTVKWPLQSQAGAVNKRYFSNDWWLRRLAGGQANFRGYGFWTLKP